MVFVHSGVFLNLLFSSKVLMGCGFLKELGCGFFVCGFLKEFANVLERVKYRTTVKTASIATATHAIQHSVGTRRLHFRFPVVIFVWSNKTFSFTYPSSESALSSFLNGSYSPVFSGVAEKVTKFNKLHIFLYKAFILIIPIMINRGSPR